MKWQKDSMTTGWLVSQPQSWVTSLQLLTNMVMMWRWVLSVEDWCFKQNSRPPNFTSSKIDETGRKKSTVTLLLRCEVIKQTILETISAPKNKIAKLLQTYQSHNTSQSHPKRSYEEKHAMPIKKSQEDIKKWIAMDISHPDLEKN